MLIVFAVCLPARHARAELSALNLQAIVDQAKPGETIVLEPGTYEGPITITKSLTIRSTQAGTVELRNRSQRPAVSIEADETTLSGLRVIDETVKAAPTLLVTGDRVVLEDLHIQTGSGGIAAKDADGGTLSRTTIEWTAEGVRMADKGNGMDLFNAHRWRITGNTIRLVHDGIYMENSDDAIVSGNVIERSRYGVHCMYTRGTKIQNNEGKLNVTGAMVMTSRQVSVTGNTFTKQSENVNSQGILLYDAHESWVADNMVVGNRVGLYVEQSTDNRLENNQVTYNFVGIQLLESSGNTIEGNAFLGNVSDAQAKGSVRNTLVGNYWDSFQGIDVNGDGKSELTYAINPFFQGLTQRRPAFQLFFQSPGMVFLEGLFQTERERWATDLAPLMAPPGSGPREERSEDGLMTGLAGFTLLGSTGLLFYRMRRRSI
ncbi:right-handed parallel beta-helix repeat-containing protein [Paenibacillus guangzhouensis]|uniref:right-handed parallel beta-helix repeat-containing protein n=1 Tax=Paenibacillus guangzhouensis TaxID=1473112 RepID=UPI001D0FF6D8|nr:right-handed parallel beta-helix repeat-containing protein [Paenibacillus guangzhouensis]